VVSIDFCLECSSCMQQQHQLSSRSICMNLVPIGSAPGMSCEAMRKHNIPEIPNQQVTRLIFSFYSYMSQSTTYSQKSEERSLTGISDQ